ncbi:hypothetical protein BKA65DRAFT_518659 [Rhexocercosporidium sp. MPI-PUGE-AT-0058]|nr:hypothetical protein BKA65DRAFT_518659 [Rhexocercosporidium sp. MPI-PUGE-AT-0058]
MRFSVSLAVVSLVAAVSQAARGPSPASQKRVKAPTSPAQEPIFAKDDKQFCEDQDVLGPALYCEQVGNPNDDCVPKCECQDGLWLYCDFPEVSCCSKCWCD